MANLEMYSITLTPKTAHKAFKALRKAGFLIEGIMNDSMGQRTPQYYISKKSVLSKRDKMVANKVNKTGVYRGTFSIMVNLALEESEHQELNDVLKGDLKLKGFHLGTDGGWLGFPYLLVYTKENYPELIKNLEIGLTEINQYFDELTTQSGFNYDQKFRDEQRQMTKKLIQDLKRENS